jgi:hypothetical protein
MFLKYPIICSHVYCYSNKALPPPRGKHRNVARLGHFYAFIEIPQYAKVIGAQILNWVECWVVLGENGVNFG